MNFSNNCMVILFILMMGSFMSFFWYQSWVDQKCLHSNVSKRHKSSLFQRHSIQSKNRFQLPDICVAMLSCKRMHHLRKSLPAIIRYFAEIEPSIMYELVVFDNGSGPDIEEELTKNYPIDMLILRRENIGIAAALNTLFFGACRAPFVLLLEEDWEAKIDTWPADVPVMSMSMHILNTDEQVLEVWLRDWENGNPYMKNRTKWLLAPPVLHLMNNTPVMYRKLGRVDDLPTAHYTNGASLKHRKRLQSIGYQGQIKGDNITDFDGEIDYGKRSLHLGLTSAHLCLPQFQKDLKCDLIPAENEPYMMLGLFGHLGNAARSPGHQDFVH